MKLQWLLISSNVLKMLTVVIIIIVNIIWTQGPYWLKGKSIILDKVMDEHYFENVNTTFTDLLFCWLGAVVDHTKAAVVFLISDLKRTPTKYKKRETDKNYPWRRSRCWWS